MRVIIQRKIILYGITYCTRVLCGNGHRDVVSISCLNWIKCLYKSSIRIKIVILNAILITFSFYLKNPFRRIKPFYKQYLDFLVSAHAWTKQEFYMNSVKVARSQRRHMPVAPLVLLYQYIKLFPFVYQMALSMLSVLAGCDKLTFREGIHAIFFYFGMSSPERKVYGENAFLYFYT